MKHDRINIIFFTRRTVVNLQERVNTLEQTNKSLTEESTAKKTRVEQLEEQVGKLTAEKEQLVATYQRKIEVRHLIHRKLE